MNDTQMRITIKSLVDFEILAIPLSPPLGHAQNLPLLSSTDKVWAHVSAKVTLGHFAACDSSVVQMWLRAFSLTVPPVLCPQPKYGTLK